MKFEQLDADHIGVTYREGFDAATGTKAVNFKIMSFFYNRGAKKKANKIVACHWRKHTWSKKENEKIENKEEAIPEQEEKK